MSDAMTDEIVAARVHHRAAPVVEREGDRND